MEVKFRDDDLDRLEIDARFGRHWPQGVVKAFRKRMQSIRAATDERDLYVAGNKTEKLKGNRSHQHSMALNDQYRLIFEIEQASEAKAVVIVAIEDYH